MQVGGISRTVNYKGYRFDIGGHRFFSKIPLVNDLWREILGEDFLVRPRLSHIHYGGRFFDYPLHIANALFGLGIVETFVVGASYAKARIAPSLPETSFEQWVSNRFGRRLYEIFFKTYTEKVWGIPCTEISAEWASQRIKNLSLTEIFRNALLGKGCSRDGQVITSLIDQFHYPRFGPGMMWERCEELLRKRGSETILGARVRKIRHDGRRVESVLAENGDSSLEISVDQVVSSLPLRDLIGSINPPAPDEVRRAALALKYRDFITIVLIVRRAKIFPDNWIYIHSPEIQMGRIQNYKNWSPDMVPDPATTSLGLEYFVSERDEMWSWPDDRLIELGIRECAQIGFIEPGEVLDGTVVRMPKAYPVYDRAYAENVAIIRKYLESLGNLQAVGRNGQHRYNNQDHSMLTGVYAARNIMGERHDIWAVNEEQDYHEETRAVPGVAPAEAESEIAAMEARFKDLLEAAFARLDPVALGVSMCVVLGAGLFLTTAILLLRGGAPVGPMMSLLTHYLMGYRVTWFGAFLGMVEMGLLGFGLGYLLAQARNALVRAYVYWIVRAAEAKQHRNLLEQV